jgi:predicted ATPase
MVLTQQGTEGSVRFTAKRPDLFPEDLLHPTESPELVSEWSTQVEFKQEEDSDWKPAAELWNVVQSARSAVYLQLQAASLARPSYTPRQSPRVEYTGAGLPSVLAYMALNRPDDFAQLQESFRRVVPTVERIRFDRTVVNRTITEEVAVRQEVFSRRVHREYMGDSIVLDMVGAPSIPGHLASEGTMLVLGLLAVMLGPIRPRLVLLDDLDHALHPKAQRDLMALLRTLLQDNENMQIVATTHSPYLLDELRPEEVRCTALRQDGTVACAPLVENPEFERWKDEMAPGEMWSLFGEKWVVGRTGEGHA